MRLRRLDSLMLETVLQLSQAGAAGTALDDRLHAPLCGRSALANL
jgi:hypothetical protein